MKSFDRETGIWNLEMASENHRCDFLLAAAIATQYAPRIGKSLVFPESVADVGCGNGRYCAILKACGFPHVVGIEGTSDARNLGVFNHIITMDLTKFLHPAKYDLVICLEVGEHIPKQHEQILIDNICRFCGKDLVLSWAVPGRGGSGHVNRQSNEYIIDEFGSRKLRFDEKTTNVLRERCYFKWFKDSLLVFERGKDDN